MPIYALEKNINYNVYYLQSIEPNSMSDKWEILTKLELENLKDGKYLCKIVSTNENINKFLIENYFTLVKNNG